MNNIPGFSKNDLNVDDELADLIHIFHPELLPDDYQPVFYELLP